MDLFRLVFASARDNPNKSFEDVIADTLVRSEDEELREQVLIHMRLHYRGCDYDRWMLADAEVFDRFHVLCAGDHANDSLIPLGEVAGKHSDVYASYAQVMDIYFDGREEFSEMQLYVLLFNRFGIHIYNGTDILEDAITYAEQKKAESEAKKSKVVRQ